MRTVPGPIPRRRELRVSRGYTQLKEYYEIVNEARPLLGFFPPADADRNAFLIMKLCNLPSSRAIRALIASQ